MFTRLGGPAAAAASLVAGVVTWILGAHVLALPYPYLTSLLAAVAAYVTAALLARATAPVRVTATAG